MGRFCVTWAYCRDAQLFLVCLITACAWNVNAWLPSSLSAIVSGCGFGLRFGRGQILDWEVGGHERLDRRSMEASISEWW